MWKPGTKENQARTCGQPGGEDTGHSAGPPVPKPQSELLRPPCQPTSPQSRASCTRTDARFTEPTRLPFLLGGFLFAWLVVVFSQPRAVGNCAPARGGESLTGLPRPRCPPPSPPPGPRHPRCATRGQRALPSPPLRCRLSPDLTARGSRQTALCHGHPADKEPPPATGLSKGLKETLPFAEINFREGARPRPAAEAPSVLPTSVSDLTALRPACTPRPGSPGTAPAAREAGGPRGRRPPRPPARRRREAPAQPPRGARRGRNKSPPPLAALTQIVPQVQQKVRRPPVELVEEGSQAEEQQGGHAEAVVAQREEGQRREGPPPLPAPALARARAPSRRRRRGEPGRRAVPAAAAVLLLLLHPPLRRRRRLTQPAGQSASSIRLLGSGCPRRGKFPGAQGTRPVPIAGCPPSPAAGESPRRCGGGCCCGAPLRGGEGGGHHPAPWGSSPPPPPLSLPLSARPLAPVSSYSQRCSATDRRQLAADLCAPPGPAAAARPPRPAPASGPRDAPVASARATPAGAAAPPAPAAAAPGPARPGRPKPPAPARPCRRGQPPRGRGAARGAGPVPVGQGP